VDILRVEYRFGSTVAGKHRGFSRCHYGTSVCDGVCSEGLFSYQQVGDKICLFFHKIIKGRLHLQADEAGISSVFFV
jgi:hypothetical protein